MPSTCISSATVVQASGAANWTKGALRTRRGAGTPVRPPAVWTKVAFSAVTTGGRLEVREGHGLEHGSPAAEAQGRRADQAVAGLAVIDDAACLYLDPCLQVVGKAETVGLTQLLQVVDDVGRGCVVVGDAALEGELGSAGDRLGRVSMRSM